MVQLNLKLSIPESLAKEAKTVGLLKPKSIIKLLRSELKSRRKTNFFKTLEKLSSLKIPALSPQEIEEEIQKVREEKKRYSKKCS